MRTILLCRHGETEWNREGRLQGRDDSPLTARGLAQAQALGAAAAARGVTRVVASPLARAATTARIVAERCGATLELHDALVELDFGRCGGLTLAEVDERFPQLRAERRRAHWTYRWPGGESYADAAARLGAWLAARPPLWAEPPVAIVGHGAASRAFVHALTGCAPEAARTIQLGSGGALIVHEDGAWQPLADLTGAEGLEREV